VTQVKGKRSLSQQRKPRVFWFSYHAPTWEGKAKQHTRRVDYGRALHQVRDATAFTYVSSVLFSGGYDFGGVLLNLPASGFSDDVQPDAPPELRNVDTLVTVTRPPLNDREPQPGGRAGRVVARSKTPLEDTIFLTLRHLFFADCSRGNVALNQRLAEAVVSFDEELAPWCDIDFWQNQRACYHQDWIKSSEGKELENHTAGYVFVTPQLLDEGKFKSPRLLGLFGLGGPETLTLARLLTGSFAPKLLEFVHSPRPRLLIIQWPVPKPPLRPASLDFLSSVSPTEIVDMECIDISTPKWAARK